MRRAIEPGDARALADAILAMRDDLRARTEMGRRSRDALEARFDRPISAAAYRRLLEDVAGSP